VAEPFSSDLQELQTVISHPFKQLALLRTALTHPSVAYDADARIEHNQRLEFLGDAVIEVVLTRELYLKFPALNEGPLTKARAQLVNRQTLATQARELRLGEFLVLSRGEELSGGRNRDSSLADAFEAMVGAIFLDGGFDAANDFVLRCFRETFGELVDVPLIDNPKGELQELLQTGAAEPPEYEIIAVTGPDHDRDFECVVYHRKKELGTGRGKSKKSAESAAALAALNALKES
jgi:ribonuclease-3